MHLALSPQHDVVVCGFWTIVNEGSSSFSRNSAWPSLTSSLRSAAEIAIASTGGNGPTLASAGGATLPLDSVSPVLMASSLPSATCRRPRRRRAWCHGRSSGRICRMPGRPRPMTIAASRHHRDDLPAGGQRQLAAVLQMNGLEDIGQRVLG